MIVINGSIAALAVTDLPRLVADPHKIVTSNHRFDSKVLGRVTPMGITIAGAAMSTSGQFRVTLHISHPELSADEVTAPFAFMPRYARPVGAPRLTKLGEVLGGVYTQTDVSLAVTDGVVDSDYVSVTDLLSAYKSALAASKRSSIQITNGYSWNPSGQFSAPNRTRLMLKLLP